MAELELLDLNNKNIGKVEVSADVFDAEVKEHLVQRYVVYQLAKKRLGSAAVKQNKRELSGSGKKPWRQKGTGRARSGNTRSPIWRGGLTVFGPSPKDYSFKLTKKCKKIALKSVLTERCRNGQMVVVDQISLENPKTKDAIALMKSMELPSKTLFLIDADNENLGFAVRNIPGADILKVDGLNVYDLLTHEKIVITKDALAKVESRLN
jgi:large subunit ribosomal protein L4